MPDTPAAPWRILQEGDRREYSRDFSGLLARFSQKQARIGVVGLGYVGLPLSLAAGNAGFGVLGFDINTTRVNELNDGLSPLKHIGDTLIAKARADGWFEATADFRRLVEVDAIIICVPTPLGPHREPDLEAVESTARAIAAELSPGQLVILESTTYPGTTRDVVKPLLEKSGLRSGVDFYLAYSPEREDPGNGSFQTCGIPKVISGDGEDARQLAEALYGSFVVRTVPVSSLETAEAVKLTENIFRAVNVALVNELKIVFSALGIDIFEVIEAAKSKPFGFMPFYPGPGLGGHCIPIDPFYLTWKARELGISTRFIELAGEINTSMPGFVIGRLREELDRRCGKGLCGANILIVGLAYKKNVDDIRESPALTIMDQLIRIGAHISYYDPYFPIVPDSREHGALTGRKSIVFEPSVLAQFDAALIVTDHDCVDYGQLLRSVSLVVDTRNVIGRLGISGSTAMLANA